MKQLFLILVLMNLGCTAQKRPEDRYNIPEGTESHAAADSYKPTKDVNTYQAGKVMQPPPLPPAPPLKPDPVWHTSPNPAPAPAPPPIPPRNP